MIGKLRLKMSKILIKITYDTDDVDSLRVETSGDKEEVTELISQVAYILTFGDDENS